MLNSKLLKSEPLTENDGVISFLKMEDRNDFYEDDYMSMNPEMHLSDANSKSMDVIRALKALSQENGLGDINIICDVGSGSGIVLRRISEWLGGCLGKQYSLICVDVSMSILREMDLGDCDAMRIHADASNLPLRDDSVGLVLLVDIIEHVNSPSLVIDEALRVGKYCVIKTPIERSLYTYLKGGESRLRKMERQYGHIQHFSLGDYRDLVKGRKVLCEFYDIIPDRWVGVDWLQRILIFARLERLYGWIFGGFKVCLIEK